MIDSFTTDVETHASSIELRLRMIQEAGFRSVHWCENWYDGVIYSVQDMQRFHALLAQHDIIMHSAHSCCGRRDASGKNVMTMQEWTRVNLNRLHFVAGAPRLPSTIPCLVIHVPFDPSIPDVPLEIMLAESVTMIDSLLPTARELGMRLAIENLYGLSHRTKLFDAILARYPAVDVGFCLDTGHAHIRGEALLLAKRYLDRLVMTHIHDNSGKTDEHRMPGEGTIDWAPLMQVLARAPHLPALNLEVSFVLKDLCHPTNAPLPSVWQPKLAAFIAASWASLQRLKEMADQK